MAMTKPFQELLERLGRSQSDAVTICYQGSAQGFRAKTTTVLHADTVVDALNDTKVNVWYEINPSNVDGRAKAEDINRLSALWIDIDFKETGIQSEHNASTLVTLISDLIGVSPTAIVHSGHGLQPYWAIDPEEEFTMEMATGILQRWGGFVRWVAASQGGSLDSVFDMARIFRAPGSINFKDATNPVLVDVEFPDNWRPLSIEEINDVLITHGFSSVTTMPSDFEQVSANEDWQYADADCHWAGNLFSTVRPITVPKSRHGWLLQQLVIINAAHRNGCLTENTAHLLIEQLSERFQQFLQTAPVREMTPGEIHGANRWAIARVETFDDRKLNEELRGHKHATFSEGEAEPVEQVSFDSEVTDMDLVPYFQETINDDFGCSDTANALRLTAYLRNDFKYVTDVGWHKWADYRYVSDKENAITQIAINSVNLLHVAELDKDQRKWAEVSLNKERLNAAIHITGTSPSTIVSAMELDAQPNELCTPAGIVNLRTGEIRKAIKGADFNTRSTVVAPFKMPTPMWSNFLTEIIEDEDRIAYLQELFGAALFGDSRFHVLPVFVGTGANGKSTILDVIMGILGDYSAMMPEDFLIDTKGAAHPTDIARLRGVRLAVASETRPDGKFNESRVKMLTGGDTLSARFMNKDFFDFKPTHTLFMAVNHLPEVKSGGDGFWRRLRKIDFRKTIPVERRKENFAKTLIAEEGPGILQWMIDGAVRITNQGMTEPESIKLSTQSYRHEEDHIAKFLDEKTIIVDKASVTRVALFNAYRDWCSENGERPISQNSLTREIKARLGVAESMSAGFKMFVGLDLMQTGSFNNAEHVTDIVGDISKERDEYWNN